MALSMLERKLHTLAMYPHEFRARHHHPEVSWYYDHGMSIMGFDPSTVFVKNALMCDMRQLRVVMAHLPDSRVVVDLPPMPELSPSLPVVLDRIYYMCRPFSMFVYWWTRPGFDYRDEFEPYAPGTPFLNQCRPAPGVSHHPQPVHVKPEPVHVKPEPVHVKPEPEPQYVYVKPEPL